MIEVRDDVDRCIVLTHPARRIVSLVPSLTETVCRLGRGDALVGVTRYCTEPIQVLVQVERVGGTKNPDVARILDLHPDLVLMNAEENRKDDFVALERAGLNVFVSFPHRARDVIGLLERIGTLTDTGSAADVCVKELRAALAEVAQTSVAAAPRVFCPIWKNPWMSFNHDTYADDMISVAGGSNVCRAGDERYCEVTLEAVAAAMPEVILLPDEPYVFGEKDLPSLAPLRDTPACRACRIHFIDGKALSWCGPRTAPGLRYLQAVIERGAGLP